MLTKRITVIFYTLAFGIAIGYWAGQESAHTHPATHPTGEVQQ